MGSPNDRYSQLGPTGTKFATYKREDYDRLRRIEKIAGELVGIAFDMTPLPMDLSIQDVATLKAKARELKAEIEKGG